MQLHTFRTTAVVLNSGGSIVLVMDIATVLWGSGSFRIFHLWLCDRHQTGRAGSLDLMSSIGYIRKGGNYPQTIAVGDNSCL